MISEKAKWIWYHDHAEPNEFAYFTDTFDFNGGVATLKICAETDYIAYVNGVMAGFGQFSGFPDEKYYDTIDITKLCHMGRNELSITVRYEGYERSAIRIEDGAGLIYTVEDDSSLLTFSSEATLGGADTRYLAHSPRLITGQLGYAVDMCSAIPVASTPCVETDHTYNIKKRPIKKTELQPTVWGTPISTGSNIYDLGQETAGYLCIRIRSKSEGVVKVAYGEHINDGEVRYLIGSRNFSLDFYCDGKDAEFCQFFARIAARYLEVFAPEDMEIVNIGIIPALYPLTLKKNDLTGLDKKIYDISVRTLRLCMNMHYEDCPWREQALYVVDSRNQMLCGYYAFEETEFARSSLILMSKSRRDDGFLELTSPAKNTPSIPFFSIMYPVAVLEYVQYTGDRSIISEVMPTMMSIMSAARDRIEENGLISEFEPPYWNFYEWCPHNDGAGQLYCDKERKKKYHLILNCAYVFAARHFEELCKIHGTEFNSHSDRVLEGINKHLYNERTGLFSTSDIEKHVYSELGCAFALLVGLGDERTVAAIKSGALIPVTLSMSCYVYDALLKADPSNRDYVLSDIYRKYTHMLSQGATTFWETLKGDIDFDLAGSLCHGWSAMPIYYFNKLKK